jgi:hypothetical protein
VARRAGITKPVGPHTLRHAFITAAQRRRSPAPGRAGSRFPRRPAHHQVAPAAAWTGTPLTSSLPTLPEPPGRQLTAHKQTPPGPIAAARRSPGSRRPGCVTDRDPDRDHEPPFCTPSGALRGNPHPAQSWMIGARQTLNSRCPERVPFWPNLAKAGQRPLTDLPRRPGPIPACRPPPGCVGYRCWAAAPLEELDAQAVECGSTIYSSGSPGLSAAPTHSVVEVVTPIV